MGRRTNSERRLVAIGPMSTVSHRFAACYKSIWIKSWHHHQHHHHHHHHWIRMSERSSRRIIILGTLLMANMSLSESGAQWPSRRRSLTRRASVTIGIPIGRCSRRLNSRDGTNIFEGCPARESASHSNEERIQSENELRL